MAQGILSKFIGGAATAGAKLYEQEAKTKREQLLWELRTKETRAYNDKTWEERRKTTQEQGDKAWEERRKTTQEQGDKTWEERRKTTQEEKTNFSGYASAARRDKAILNTVEEMHPDDGTGILDEDTIKARKGEDKKLRAWLNEDNTRDIFDYKYREQSKPTIEPDSRTGATTQNKDDLENLKLSESKSRFNANGEIRQLNDIKKLLGFQPKDFEVLSSKLGVSIKDRESLERYIFDLSGKNAEYWKQKINKK
jgi:hypothetical protein